MAAISKKDALIADAQKFALHGQFDRAAKAYEQVMALEPTAINLRHKLAEFLIKCNRNDDARIELETIGKNYTKNGFYLKAIAVYKQLQKLFPSDISLSLILAELNGKYGLVANSLAEYKTVYEYYEKNGNIAESLVILDRMQNIDPHNIPIKLKLAEAYLKEGKTEEAYLLFTKVAVMFLERSDNTTFFKICRHLQKLLPDRSDFMFEVLAGQISQGNAAVAIVSLQNLLRSNPNNKNVWDLTAKAYLTLGQPQRAKIAYQHYLKFFPAEPSAIFGLISSSVAEQNFPEAVDLLDKHETSLISAGFLEQLEEIYIALDKINPDSTRILEGLFKLAKTAGNDDKAQSLASKLQSMKPISTGEQTGIPEAKPSYSEIPRSESPVIAASEKETLKLEEEVESEIEIEIEIDLDSTFNLPDQGTQTEIETDADAKPDAKIESTAVVDKLSDSVDLLLNTNTATPRGVKFANKMEDHDPQSHFDLGQAFKEMGLYDEAINEFRQASQEASLRVESLLMECECLRESGNIKKSIPKLIALLKAELSREESCAVKYELASCYESLGEKEAANSLFNEINTTNPGFRNIRSRFKTANQPDSLDFSDEDIEDFGLK